MILAQQAAIKKVPPVTDGTFVLMLHFEMKNSLR
jgi:hypothetical protein